MEKIYIITWRYSDNSAYGVISTAFTDKDDVSLALKLLLDHGDTMKVFTVAEVEVIE